MDANRRVLMCHTKFYFSNNPFQDNNISFWRKFGCLNHELTNISYFCNNNYRTQKKVMQTLSHKVEIENTFSRIRTISFKEKKSPLLYEEKVNAFLDVISELKIILVDKTKTINNINERIEKLTWFRDLDDECLMLINDLISSAKDLRSSLIRQYVSMILLRKKGIAKNEIRDFKNAIDDLKETYEDLESVFFYLPKIKDFTETTKQLSLV
jgi:hypothetical protein